MHADLLVKFLPVTTRLHAGHENVLGGHEWQLSHHVRVHHLWPHVHAVGDVHEEGKDHVGGEERLRQRDTTDC